MSLLNPNSELDIDYTFIGDDIPVGNISNNQLENDEILLTKGVWKASHKSLHVSEFTGAQGLKVPISDSELGFLI